MKKFYCLYNKNNLPFSWKLKQAGEKSLANFKSREDCLNYYLSLKNIGIIWFQKANSKISSFENIKDSFDGYIKSGIRGDYLIHSIEAVPTAKINVAKALKKNLYYLLQIDPITGKDLLVDKGIDRLYNNKNSYLIFDNDIAEEVMSIYDSQNIKIPDKDIFNNSNYSSSELMRKKIQDSPSNHSLSSVKKDDKILTGMSTEKDINIDNAIKTKPSEDIDKSLELFKEIQKNEENELLSETEPIILSPPSQGKEQVNPTILSVGINNKEERDKLINNEELTTNAINQKNDFNNLNHLNSNYNPYMVQNYVPQNQQTEYMDSNYYQYENNYYDNYNEFPNHYLIDANDFNFQNDFENYSMEMEPINEFDFNNNIFQNYFNNNDKIFKNNFYKINRSLERENIMQNKNKQNFKKPQQGTVEFTAVPNQMLNTEINPLGGETMIFNPYALQPNNFNTQSFNPMQPQLSGGKETIIQPIIQPVIQTVYQPVYQPLYQPQASDRTVVLDPIINPPISDQGYNYSQYSNVLTEDISLPKKTNNTSDFIFNNTAQQEAHKPANPVSKEAVAQVAPVVRPAPQPGQRRPIKGKKSGPQKYIKKPGSKKPSKVIIYLLSTLAFLVLAGIIAVGVLAGMGILG